MLIRNLGIFLILVLCIFLTFSRLQARGDAAGGMPLESGPPIVNFTEGVEPGERRLVKMYVPDVIEENISIIEVQRMAIEYAEVSPEKIKGWRERAKWKALMPKISMGFSESDDDNVEIYKSATTSYVVAGPREVNKDWDMSVTWDLSDIIWSGDQTTIDVRSKLMVQLRDDILKEVTWLYFERKRLLIEMQDANNMEENPDPTRQIRVEELTAYIDALTGAAFSKALEKQQSDK